MKFYLFYLSRVNIVAKEYLLLNKDRRAEKCGGDENVEDGPGPSGLNKKSKRKRNRKKKKMSCIPNPNTMAW